MTASRNKYVSVNSDSSAKNYTEIANIMTASGDKMNHATVRNIIIRGFSKVVTGVGKDYGKIVTKEKAEIIAKSPDFQNALITILKGNRNDS